MHLILWFSLLLKVTFAVNLGRNCQCAVTGDPHYRTFDGQHITLTGHCKYLMVTTKEQSKLDPLKVEVKNKKRKNVKVPYTNRIDITLGKQFVQFHQHSHVTVNGLPVTLPFSTVEFKVTRNRGGVMELITGDGGVITFDGHQNGNVTLPLCYAGNVRGLCGDCNGLEDDYRLGNGSDVTRQPNKFDLIGESYKVPDKDDTDPGCRQAGAFHRLKRQTVPFPPYENLRNTCNNLSPNHQLQLKSAQNNLMLQIDTFRKVCNLMEQFERTTCKGNRSVFLTCDDAPPKVRQPRYYKYNGDYYAADKVHFIRVAKSKIHQANTSAAVFTQNLYYCISICSVNPHCIGIEYSMGMACISFETDINSITVGPAPDRDVFFRIPDAFGDIFPVQNVSKWFSPDMALHASLDKCKDICRQCVKCEGIQYYDFNKTCVVFIGIGQNGPLNTVTEQWAYYGFLNRMCSKECAQNARCLVSKNSDYCKCERDYIGDGVKECKIGL